MHICKRFKTVTKCGGVRLVVACRECGKAHDTIAYHQLKYNLSREQEAAFNKEMDELAAT